MSKKNEYLIAAVVTCLVVGWAVFAIKAPTRQQTSERFAMLTAVAVLTLTAAAIRGRARREASTGSASDENQ